MYCSSRRSVWLCLLLAGCSGEVAAIPADGGALDRGTILACGYKHACVLRANGSILCWGLQEEASLPKPDSYVSIGAHFGTCGLAPDGTVTCWELGEDVSRWAPEGSFVALDYGDLDHACALTAEGDAPCWEVRGNHPVTVPLPPEPLRLVRAGNHPCGLKASDGVPICWSGGDDKNPVPEEPMTALGVLRQGACGIRQDGTLTCWRVRPDLQPPSGTFIELEAREYSACAKRPDESLVCWGELETVDGPSLPSGPFHEFCVGAAFGCGIRPDGTLACWGFNDVGQASPPEGTFP